VIFTVALNSFDSFPLVLFVFLLRWWGRVMVSAVTAVADEYYSNMLNYCYLHL